MGIICDFGFGFGLWRPNGIECNLLVYVVVIDKKTKEKIVFVHGDTSAGSKNDRKMTEIMGEDWRHVCRYHVCMCFNSHETHRRSGATTL